METKLKKIKRKRIFSEELRRKAVTEYEKGEMTVLELSKFYGVSITSIYNWIYKYSRFEKNDMQIIEKKMSNTHKIKELESKIKDLERAVGVKQMNIDFLEKMIEIAKEEFDIDIKKNCSTKQSNGLGQIKKN